MSAVAVGLSAGSFVWVTVTVVAYFSTIPKGKVPVGITGMVLKLLVGLGLAAAAVAWSYRGGSLGAAVIAPAAVATLLASMILWLLSQRKTPIGELKVKVGDTLLAFEAATAEGTRFHTDALAGKRTLLKFFRGGW
jgi:hypothetical protein